MRPLIKVTAFISFATVLVYVSCKKLAIENNSTVNNPVMNKPPVANAGNDTILIYPADSVILVGSRSSDPDDGIAGYQWTKISGPSSFNIAHPNVAETHVKNLVEGNYQFELKVTDAGGLFSKDTTNLFVYATCDNSNRPKVMAKLTAFGTLSKPKIGAAVATAGKKFYLQVVNL